ncbi:MAG TPA: MFS transporter [Vineibacter sp.]|nr:MFS transporter [Vineibacter sp.]
MADRAAVTSQITLGTGVFGVNFIAMAMVNALPFLTGANIDQRGLSTVQAGAVNSVELLCCAILAIVLAKPSLALRPRLLGWAACGLFAAGNLMALSADLAMLFVARGIAGIGEGLAVSASARAMAHARSPATVSGYVATIVALIGAGEALLIEAIVARHGYVGGYVGLAVIGLICGVIASALPRTPVMLPAPARGATAGSAVRWRAALPVVVAACTVLFGAGMVWSFAERLGLATGLSSADVARTISLTALLCIGGGVAAVIAARFGRDFLMAAIGATVFGLSVAAFALATTPLAYVASLSVLSFAYLFAGPFITSIALRVDPSGGLLSAARGAQLLTSAAAPTVGGLFLAYGSVEAVALLATATSGGAVAAIFDAYRQSHRSIVQPAPALS